MTKPAFTIVIAAFNECDLVGTAIRSVIAQTRRDWRLIVVDDGSTDGTAEAVSGFVETDPRVELLRKPNEGLAAARNTAINASESPFVCFLDADDLWLPGYLDAMASALDDNEDAGVAYADAWAMDIGTGRFRVGTVMQTWGAPENLPEDPESMMRLMVRRNYVWVSATVRRQALTDAGLFRPEFRVAEDIDLWFRVLACGYGMVQAPGGPLGIKRERAGALTAREFEMVAGVRQVMLQVSSNEQIPLDVQGLAKQRETELSHRMAVLGGKKRARLLTLNAYRKLGAVRRLMTDRFHWRNEVPNEVRAAFPDLVESD